MTDILTNDEISLLRTLEKKSRTITGNFAHNRYIRARIKSKNVIGITVGRMGRMQDVPCR